MLLMFESLKRVSDIYINPRNYKIMPLFLRNWRDLLSLDEKTYGIYAKTIYNPKERFLIKSKKDEQKAFKLVELYNELLKNPTKFCHKEYYEYQLKVKQFEGLPFANGWVGSRVVLVGEAPGRKGCGYAGICFYRDASGILLRKALFTLGINPDFVYITNVLTSFPCERRGFQRFNPSPLAGRFEGLHSLTSAPRGGPSPHYPSSERRDRSDLGLSFSQSSLKC